jgi:hypothetical protein
MADKTIVRSYLVAYAPLLSVVPAERIFYARQPRATSTPTTGAYITYQKINSTPENDLSDVPGVDRQLIQLDLYAPTTTELEAILAKVRAALDPHGHEISTHDLSDFELDRERIVVSYEFYIQR